jgi:Helix-turn-helix domain
VVGKGMIFGVEGEPTAGGQDRRTQADTTAGGSGWVTTDVAAKALGVSPRTIRRFIDRGDLEGKLEEEGITRAWMVSIDSLHALRDRRKAEGHDRRESSEMSVAVDSAEDTLADVLRDLAGRLETRIAEATELRTRLEITERAESSLREERERLLADLERERTERDHERQRVDEELQRLRAELEAERSKGFWSRLFRG